MQQMPAGIYSVPGPVHRRGVRDEQSRTPALRDFALLMGERWLHSCTRAQTLERVRVESASARFCSYQWLTLPVLGNTSYRSFLSRKSCVP